VTVFGISARNAILQLAHYEHLVEVEGAAWSPGLLSSTLLNLIVLPALAQRYITRHESPVMTGAGAMTS
jgi:hypothetical protein